MSLRIITKYDAADPEIRCLTKSILKPFGYAIAMPPAWELIITFLNQIYSSVKKTSFHLSCTFTASFVDDLDRSC